MSVLHNASDDDGEPNTYDRDDSFIDDKTQKESAETYDPANEDSDYEPDDSQEDVKELMKEAKGFMKNKKMQKKV